MAKKKARRKKVTLKKTRTTTRLTIQNPKKNAPKLTRKQSKKRFAQLKKAGCHPRRVKLPDGSRVVVRDKRCKAPALNPRASPALQRARAEARRWRHKADKLSAKLARRQHKKKRNPQRPPKRWFDACLAGVDGRRYARDPAAICGATWWRKPPAERRAIVRKLERGSRRDRRAAVAIAKAEAHHADRGRPPRRHNGGMNDAQARAEYERTHWGERGRDRVASARAANPRHGTATELGTLVSVVYETTKRGDGKSEYEHEFEGRRPKLLYNDGGLVIAGGSYKIARGGIDG